MTIAYSEIADWTQLELVHLVYAYRKAKADCFFDRTIGTAELFTRYEENLAKNLDDLLKTLQQGGAPSVLSPEVERVRVVAKKLAVEPLRAREAEKVEDDYGVDATTNQTHGHAFFSDSKRAFDRLLRSSSVTPEFRLVGDFNVNVHIISAIWVLSVGDKLDQSLSTSAFGARLRRVRPASGGSEGEVGPLHVEALGSFQPYFGPYKAWRGRGLSAIRGELKAQRPVIAISLDLANYYHQIDPAFLLEDSFYSSIGVELSAWQADLNACVVEFLQRWGQYAAARLANWGALVSGRAGIPIGLSATRIISNVLLAELDRQIEQGLAPIYYGRYVDDIFLVIRDPGNLLDARDALKYIGQRVDAFPVEIGPGPIILRLPGRYQGESVLALQPAKQKAFFLEGSSGLDLLDSIEAQINSVSSERRLMPSPDRLSSMASAKVLSAAGTGAEEVDTLRRADGLSVRRLGWALQLRAVEILAKDLRRDDWKDERNEFYRFSISHILRADRILDHFDYLPRLLSISVAMTDWAEAKQLFDAAMRALLVLQQRAPSTVRANGIECSDDVGLWDELRTTATDLAREAVLTAIRWNTFTGRPHELPKVAVKLCELIGLHNEQEIFERALALREADLAKTPYKQHLRLAAARHRPATEGESWVAMSYGKIDDLLDFLSSCQSTSSTVGAARVREGLERVEISSVSLLPYIVPTRPYTTQEISLYLPEKCVIGDARECATNWARYTRAVRGVWVWGAGASMPTLLRSQDADDLERTKVAYLGGGGQLAVRLGISSLLTEDASWRAAANGRSDLSRERYKRIETIVNQAVVAVPKPNYLLLPELSLPERWIGTVSSMLSNAGIGLIAGMDYQRSSRSTIHSSAVLVLADTRLGYPANVEIRQVKAQPAPGEDKVLDRDFGLKWTTLPTDKPVYIHDGFSFGVLVCSELQNVEYRLRFQGDVDCLMILSWNQDIETFSALVESASLDVHANIALVNNRRYGDSRVRTPAKKSHMRDVCRLRGGQNEHVVIVECATDRLREFQSRAKRWPEEDDPYKPVPEGYELASYRRAIPK